MPVFFLYCTRKPPRNQGHSLTFHSSGRLSLHPPAAGRLSLHPLAAAGQNTNSGTINWSSRILRKSHPTARFAGTSPFRGAWLRSVKGSHERELSPKATEGATGQVRLHVPRPEIPKISAKAAPERKLPGAQTVKKPRRAREGRSPFDRAVPGSTCCRFSIRKAVQIYNVGTGRFL